MPSTPCGECDMSDFNLKHEIKKVIDSTDLANPHDIAAKVAESIPAKLLRVALAQALPELVRVELGRARTHAVPQPTTASNRSSKVTGIREAWRRHLRDRVHVGRGIWQMLADCTAENFRAAAEERRANAAANLAAADRYDGYAEACEK